MSATRKMLFQELQTKYQNQYKVFVVDAFIMNEKKQILLQRRSANRRLFPLFWDAVGGHVDPGETLEQALHREVFEETQLQITETVGLAHFFVWPEDHETINFQFLCKATGTLQLEKHKVTEARWVGYDDLASLGTYLSAQMQEGLVKAFSAINRLDSKSIFRHH